MDMNFRTMRAAVHEYYSMRFRGETGMLQLVMAEFRVTRHMHRGCPKKSYCYKCRLLLEMSYLVRPWLMPLETESKLLWYDESDLKFEEDEQVER